MRSSGKLLKQFMAQIISPSVTALSQHIFAIKGEEEDTSSTTRPMKTRALILSSTMTRLNREQFDKHTLSYHFGQAMHWLKLLGHSRPLCIGFERKVDTTL